ncbi:rhodanese-like domain-containing protein [Cyclobacterium marinum]|uniref:rhodanese-like domain-containing protein n=1 Tax=Cyclobacterium marinum TaxID=104 RepID=UPI0011EC4E15|nr:rhodanese-like domain-containing protein [Cyclobacterium marinum]MBI0397318.1 rhodanese-like domain-containing protein [Cyclobacterium marinum]
MDINKLIKENRGTIIDVRTPMEFGGGNAEGSINVPLQELESRKEELELLKKPLILCCASGGRSGQATQFLKQQGIECYNGGSWLEVNYYQTQTA